MACSKEIRSLLLKLSPLFFYSRSVSNELKLKKSYSYQLVLMNLPQYGN